MKVLKMGAVALLLAFTYHPTPASANAEQLVASICDYVAANDKNRLRSKLSDSGIRLRNIYDGIKCNGMSLLRFALTSGADDTGEFIAKQLSGSSLNAPEADGKTIVAWADANGFGGSATIAAVKERL
ncbi:DUF3718 domain-containing protein [Gallaecimonas kandeliae]|uniref:DUF3718 domain-containing protein n=1 Tax=Gallaecimonas kandeliae TaxID=3029055 RepID=UPI00264932D9|nr:DUF3718 domain-containing protein [Gallaecimonas kandeliae]WKE66135.1 DUF3718 domain-containing protein [Gallaecimonas kandeliae]